MLREVLARGREDGRQHTVGGLTSEKGTVIQPIHGIGGRADSSRAVVVEDGKILCNCLPAK